MKSIVGLRQFSLAFTSDLRLVLRILTRDPIGLFALLCLVLLSLYIFRDLGLQLPLENAPFFFSFLTDLIAGYFFWTLGLKAHLSFKTTYRPLFYAFGESRQTNALLGWVRQVFYGFVLLFVYIGLKQIWLPHTAEQIGARALVMILLQIVGRAVQDRFHTGSFFKNCQLEWMLNRPELVFWRLRLLIKEGFLPKLLLIDFVFWVLLFGTTIFDLVGSWFLTLAIHLQGLCLVYALYRLFLRYKDSAYYEVSLGIDDKSFQDDIEKICLFIVIFRCLGSFLFIFAFQTRLSFSLLGDGWPVFHAVLSQFVSIPIVAWLFLQFDQHFHMSKWIGHILIYALIVTGFYLHPLVLLVVPFLRRYLKQSQKGSLYHQCRP